MPLGRSFVRNKARPSIQQVTTIPAPIGGLNARDPLGAMPPTDAFNLVNWIPSRFGLNARKGFQYWSFRVTLDVLGTAPIRAIHSWFGANTTIPTDPLFQTDPTTLPGKVFMTRDGGIYEVSGRYTAGTLAQALSGAAYAGISGSVSFSNSAGSWLLLCSEIDGYFTYDGATWTKVILGGGATQVSVSDPTKFCSVAIWKRRAWFVIKDTAKVAYLPVDSIYGAAAELDLGPLLKHGGSVAWIANWTIDAGEGIDDFLVIAGENGDIIIYKGTDPSSATTFSLVGVWYAGEVPKGRKGFVSMGGDLLIISNSGINPLSYITRGGASLLTTDSANYTDKIQQLFAQDISTKFNKYGWELLPIPRENLLVVTVPFDLNETPRQYVLNLSSLGWCIWEGIPMNCTKNVANWPLFGDAGEPPNPGAFFLYTGNIYMACFGYRDFHLNGAIGIGTDFPIAGEIQPAFSYFLKEGDASNNKHFLMARANFVGPKSPGYVLKVNASFDTTLPATNPALNPDLAPLWGTAIWGTSTWPLDAYSFSEWRSVENVGFAGQASLKTIHDDAATLISIDYMTESGGPM